MPDLFNNPHGYLTGQAELFDTEPVTAPARAEGAEPERVHREPEPAAPKHGRIRWLPLPKKDRTTLRIEKQYHDTAATTRLKGI